MWNVTDKKKQQPMPDIIVWSWMREALKLSGVELLLFAYLFEITFDGVHKCFEKLLDLEYWFGLTRQALSRHIDKMVSKNILHKDCKQDATNPMIKHNSYAINIEYVTRVCEQADFETYKNFLESYRVLLAKKFPLEQVKIDSYIDNLEQWYYNKNIKIVVTFNQLVQLMRSENVEEVTLDNLLKTIQTIQPKVPELNKKSTKQTKKSGTLLEKPKRKSKQTLKNEWDKEKRSMNQDFVMYRAKNNEELLSLLDSFLDTDNGRSYTPAQWGQQLDYLFKHGRTVERMIEGIRFSYMNNYRSIYIVDKSEVDIDEKLEIIEEYVREEGENSSELREYLMDYVLETPKGKSYTVKQFKLALKTLTSLCESLQAKINSVKTSYANSYAALAYPQTQGTQTSTQNVEVDMEEKETLVNEFIAKGYYYLIPELKQLLLQYIKTVPAGKSMAKELFALNLDNLRLFCFLDDVKVQKVKMAILNNYQKFATEDFEESKRLKARFETRESHADDLDRTRKQNVLDAKRKNPNNPLLQEVELPRKERTIV